MNELIQIYITGGTFDKEYNLVTGELYFNDTHLKPMLELGRCTLDVDIKTLMMIDSLKMTESDRSIILHNCKQTVAHDIVITHGTDTMVETAKYLAEANIKDKTIVLTGAMIPYAFGMSSDGFFNMGAALAFAQSLPNGVFVCMNGRYFEWDKVSKNRKTGYFESTTENKSM